MFELVDTHCHLDFNLFDIDREAVILRARDACVVRILNPGVDLATSERAVKLAEIFTEVYAAVGVHPNDALSWDDRSPDILRALAHQPKVVAIGEIGLDYYHDDAPHDLQKRILQEQLLLAKELSLPVIIHNRQATEDIVDLLNWWCSELAAGGSKLVTRPGVLHSFSADERVAEKAMELNFYLGITGPVTFKNAQVLQQVVESAPLESLLIETDAPFLTPHPHRGKRNEPAYVRWVAEEIAKIRNLSVDALTEQIMINSEKLFNW